MVNVRALVCLFVVLWAGSAQAALIYKAAELDIQEGAPLSSTTRRFVVQDDGSMIYFSSGSNNIVTADTFGNESFYNAPAGEVLYSMDRESASTFIVGSQKLSGAGSLYSVDMSGTFTHLATLPNGYYQASAVARSSANGNILVRTFDSQLLMYDSSGTLLWDVMIPDNGTSDGHGESSFDVAGNAYHLSAHGAFYSINQSDGTLTPTTFQPSSSEYFGSTLSYVDGVVWTPGGNLLITAVQDGNEYGLFRFNPTTGETEIAAYWGEEIPLTNRGIGYGPGGLYVTSLNVGELEINAFSLFSSEAFAMESGLYGLDLITGNLDGPLTNGPAPEPSSLLLLVGLLGVKFGSRRYRSTCPTER